MLRIIYKDPWSQLKTARFYQDVFCEFVLSFLLLMGNILLACSIDASPGVGLLQGAIMAGLLVGSLIESFGHISLALFNPALTYVLVCTGQLNLFKGIVYTIVQSAGGILGSLSAHRIVTDDMASNLKPFKLADSLTVWQGVCVECFIAGTMLFIVLGAADGNNRKPSAMFALPIGFSVIMGILVAGNISGGVINPLVVLGRSVLTGVWENHWVYWVGEYLGGTLAFIIYEICIFRRETNQKETEDVITLNGTSVNGPKEGITNSAYLPENCDSHRL